jgi:CTP synthase (UTP-ammonia lyase)
VLYVHVTLLPALAATGELKTKPTQHSVKELRGIGIQPDVIVLRSDHPVPDEIREKIALFTDVATDAVIPAETADTIYEVPLMFEASGLGRLVVRELGLGDPDVAPDLDSWRALVDRIKAPKPILEIALVGKYIELPDAYLSVTEALRHAAWAHEVDAKVRWVTGTLTENFHEHSTARRGPVPGASGIAASSRSSPTARDTGSRTSACAWASSARSSNSPATWSARRTPTPPSSTCSPSTRSSTSCPTSATWRTRAARCVSGSIRLA